MKASRPDRECPECCEGAIASPPASTWHNEDEELAALAKALGHPARVQIVRFLVEHCEGQCICGDICDEIPLAQSTVSQHLKTLKEAGLISGEVDGPRICYSINRSAVERLAELIAAIDAL